ncbi:TPA: restriction endonuclease subunit S [Streptococcus suis]
MLNHHLAVQSQAIYQKLIATSEKSEAILSDIATITMGQSPKGDTYNNDKIGLPLLNGAADFRGKITPSKWTSDPKKIVKGGEYIFGVRATIGLTTKVFSKYAIGRGTGSALVKNKLYDEFLYFVLKQMFEFFENAGSGTVYVNISKNDFDNYKFDLPPESSIEQFHFTVKPLLDLIYNNNAENERLAKLRDTLLPKLMSGEITVSQVAK